MALVWPGDNNGVSTYISRHLINLAEYPVMTIYSHYGCATVPSWETRKTPKVIKYVNRQLKCVNYKQSST